MSKSSCPVCDEDLTDPRYIIYKGKKGVAAGKVCFDADPAQITGSPFQNMFTLRVDPRRGHRMFLKFEKREDAFKWDKFKAGDNISFEGCIHAFKSTKSGTKRIGKWKGPHQLQMLTEAATRQVVFDISYITQSIQTSMLITANMS